MTLLVLGLTLFLGIHLLPSVPVWREVLVARLGAGLSRLVCSCLISGVRADHLRQVARALRTWLFSSAVGASPDPDAHAAQRDCAGGYLSADQAQAFYPSSHVVEHHLVGRRAFVCQW